MTAERVAALETESLPGWEWSVYPGTEVDTDTTPAEALPSGHWHRAHANNLMNSPHFIVCDNDIVMSLCILDFTVIRGILLPLAHVA